MEVELDKEECKRDMDRLAATIEKTVRAYTSVEEYLNAAQISDMVSRVGELRLMQRRMITGIDHCPHYHVGDICCYCGKKGVIREVDQRNRGET